MKKSLSIFTLLLLSIHLYAERVDRNAAMKIAATIVNEANLNEIKTRNYNNMYIFSSDNSFVIVSADDRVRPIIGYSNDNPFVVSEANTNVNYWLDKVNREVQYAIDNDIKATEDIINEWTILLKGEKLVPKNRGGVDALLTTLWSQTAPFNDMCPDGTVTGCAATAMAQVMKYWNWPPQGVGTHTYTEPTYGDITVDFGNTTYDWRNMTNSYSSGSPKVEKDAVATLMYHCGVSINMVYGKSASAAYPSDILNAMVTYFDYKSSAFDVWDDYWSVDEWKNLLKEELDARRPVLYSGWDIDGGGHSFVCDGYDENDNFHFNWGWEGYCDGYYAIGALSPGTGGVGSGSGQYNEDAYITVGIEPNFNYENTLHLTTTAEGYEAIVELTWASYSSADSFNVYKVINGTPSLLANVTDYNYTDTGLEFNKEYCYIVRSVVDGMENNESNESCITIIPNTCIAPSNIQADIVVDDPDYKSKFKITLTWEAIDNAIGYIVYADGKKFKEVTENTLIAGTNKEKSFVFNIQTICDDESVSQQSEPYTVDVKDTGIEEYENNLKIFPNPVNDKLFIDTDIEIEEVSIFNVTGIMVYSETNVNKDYLKVDNLNKGVYIINLKTNEGNIVRRFIKE